MSTHSKWQKNILAMVPKRGTNTVTVPWKWEENVSTPGSGFFHSLIFLLLSLLSWFFVLVLSWTPNSYIQPPFWSRKFKFNMANTELLPHPKRILHDLQSSPSPTPFLQLLSPKPWQSFLISLSFKPLSCNPTNSNFRTYPDPATSSHHQCYQPSVTANISHLLSGTPASIMTFLVSPQHSSHSDTFIFNWESMSSHFETQRCHPPHPK